MTKLLRKILPFDDLGWAELGEEFTRFTLCHTPWFNVYLHRLNAPQPHPQCHDHPWSFIAILLIKGYDEFHDGFWYRRRPGSILLRPARYSHNVVTHGTSWSLIITSRKFRKWGFIQCQ